MTGEHDFYGLYVKIFFAIVLSDFYFDRLIFIISVRILSLIIATVLYCLFIERFILKIALIELILYRSMKSLQFFFLL